MIGDDAFKQRLSELARSRRAGAGQASSGEVTERSAAKPGERPVSAGGASEERREARDGGAATGCSVADAGQHRRSGPPADTGRSPGFAADRAREAPLGVEDYLPGGEWRDERGAVFVHERLRSEIESPLPDWGRLERTLADEPDLVAIQALGLENVLFLDLETGGFSSSPVFLAGTMRWNGGDFVLRQYFARHYGEEGALLRALCDEARRFAFMVTFNGKSYDAPFLRDRARVHGVALELPARHLDLLHPARRRWKRKLANCRLQTLELYICHRRRSGDVPSEEVPGLYHDFVRRGDPYRLVPVFHHNMLDVITMHEVLSALCSPRDPRPRGGWEEGESWDFDLLERLRR